MLTLTNDNPTLAEMLAQDDRSLLVWRGRLLREIDRAATVVDALRLRSFLGPIEEEATKRGLVLAEGSRFNPYPHDLEPEGEDGPASWPEEDGLDWMRAAYPSRRDLPDPAKEPCNSCLNVQDGCRMIDGVFWCGYEIRRGWREGNA